MGQTRADGASGSSRCSWTVWTSRSAVLGGKHIAIWGWWFLVVVTSLSPPTLIIAAMLVLWAGPWKKVDWVLPSETPESSAGPVHPSTISSLSRPAPANCGFPSFILSLSDIPSLFCFCSLLRPSSECVSVWMKPPCNTLTDGSPLLFLLLPGPQLTLCQSCIRVSCKYVYTLAYHLSRQAHALSIPNHLRVTWLELAPDNMVGGQEIPGSPR